MKIRLGTTLLTALVLALLTTGCSDSPTSPGIQPEIVNSADSFEYQVSDILNYSGIATHIWENSGTTANLNLSTAGDAGQAILTVLDATATHVFSRRWMQTARSRPIPASPVSGRCS